MDDPGYVEQRHFDRGVSDADHLARGVGSLYNAAPPWPGDFYSQCSNTGGIGHSSGGGAHDLLLQQLNLYKTLIDLIFIEVAYGLPFAILVFRAFVGSIPRELDEAAVIDGASPLRVFFQVILPLLKSAVVTIIVVQSVAVYNDFARPLYFLPGSQNVTVQLTLFS